MFLKFFVLGALLLLRASAYPSSCSDFTTCSGCVTSAIFCTWAEYDDGRRICFDLADKPAGDAIVWVDPGTSCPSAPLPPTVSGSVPVWSLVLVCVLGFIFIPLCFAIYLFREPIALVFRHFCCCRRSHGAERLLVMDNPVFAGLLDDDEKEEQFVRTPIQKPDTRKPSSRPYVTTKSGRASVPVDRLGVAPR